MNLSFVKFSINCISAFIEKEQEKDLQLFLTLLETLLGFKLLHKTSVTGRALTDVLTFTHTNKSIDFYKIYTFIWFYCSYSIYNYSRSLTNAIIFKFVIRECHAGEYWALKMILNICYCVYKHSII